MSSVKFLQKKIVSWGHRCLVVMLSFSLGACTHFSNTASNNKSETERDPAAVIVEQKSFYLKFETEPFPYRPRRHRVSGNVYGREYKERMKTEKTGVVVYECTPLGEGVEDRCEAITQVVSLAELQRKINRLNSREETAHFVGALGGGLSFVGFTVGVCLFPLASGATVLIATGAANISSNIAALIIHPKDKEMKVNNLAMLRDQENDLYLSGNIVELKNSLIMLTSEIVRDRR